MFLLYETAAGYAVFKVSDSLETVKTADIWKHFESSLEAKKVLDLVHFKKFKNMTQALEAAVAMSEGTMGKSLKKLVKGLVKTDVDSLAVNNPKLASLIKEKFQVNCVADSRVVELMRGVRTQLNNLIEEQVESKELAAMTLGLAHSLCRYKLKFSADQADTMVIQAVGLLDDLDKEINCYVMRCREWYGWHFPELGSLLTDSMTYVRVARCIGMRNQLNPELLKSYLSEEDIAKVEELALHSMGSEITDEDNDRIKELCTQIIELDKYRDSLSEYMRVRMAALAPNMTALVGEVLAARLIARAGSLVNLAKSASSTVQILGAEKALFRALKTKRDTPKYGLIYHAQLIGSAPQPMKGKMARMLAAKLSLSCRVDAFSERPVVDTAMALGHRAGLEQKLKVMENVAAFGELPGSGRTPKQCSTWTPKVERSGYDKTAVLKERKRPVQEIKPPMIAEKKMKKEEGLMERPSLSASGEVKHELSEELEEVESVPKTPSRGSAVSSSWGRDSSTLARVGLTGDPTASALRGTTSTEEEITSSSFDMDTSSQSFAEMMKKRKQRRQQRRAERKAALAALKAGESASTAGSGGTSVKLLETSALSSMETTAEEIPREGVVKRKKKKKKLLEPTTTTEETTDISMVVAPSEEVVKKKKKKKKLEVAVPLEEAASATDVSSILKTPEEGVVKKKKKKVASFTATEEETPTLSGASSMLRTPEGGDGEKKKPSLVAEEQSSPFAAVEAVEEEGKRKKKKKKKMAATSAGTAGGQSAQ